MSAADIENGPRPPPPLVDILAMLAESAARSLELFPNLEIVDVVDPLQDFAESTGLVAGIGQDRVQAIISGGAEPAEELPPSSPMSHHIVARDGVASASELQRMIDRCGEERRRRNGPPQATIDAFHYVVNLDDQERLDSWLADHAQDASALIEMLRKADAA
jgi:hypothetical protein